MKPVYTSNREKMNRKKIHRAMGVFLSAAMIFHMLPVGAGAVYAWGEDEGLCRHHTAHTPECGYAEEGKCTHEHTEGCYKTVTDCVHIHTEECFRKSVSGNEDSSTDAEKETGNPENCTHSCTEESGCIKKELDCHHVHDENCGYAEAKPCTYVCSICPIEELINDLPDAVSEENADEVRGQLKEILALFSKLTEEEQGQIDVSPCYKLQEKLDQANSPAEAEEIRSAKVSVQDVLDFSNGGTGTGDLGTEGYHWDENRKTLQLKNVTIDNTVTLPDATVTIETEGNCSIKNLSVVSNPQNTKLTFSGTGTLTIIEHIEISGGNGNTLTIEEHAHVVAQGGLSIGASGGTDSTVTVKGTLNATGAGETRAISAGKVVVDSGGELDVSGKYGVQLNVQDSFGEVFTINKNGCFTANCSDFNVCVIHIGGQFPEGSHTDQAINVPDGYLPTDCEVRQNKAGEINLMKKGTEQVYTGFLTIPENHDWSKDWTTNATNHWQECLYKGCDKKNADGRHYFDDTGNCITCNVTLRVTLINANNLTYNGKAQTPGGEVKVEVGNEKLDPSYYNTVYENNINAGTAFATVVGKGGLDGLKFQQTVPFTIAKANPTITWKSPTQTVTYSGRQAEITPPDVTLVNGEKFNGQISYSYAAGTPGLPTNAGTYTVKASIAEQTNYTAAVSTNQLNLTIAKAENAPNMPSEEMNVSKKCEKVSDVKLPEGWKWQDTDTRIPLEIEKPQNATAVYIGPDKGNYINESVIVTITRSNCDHNNTELRNVVAATCQQKGYSGDTYCLDCGRLLTKGAETALTGHSGGTACCISGKICEVCGTEYTEKDSGVHLHTETRGKKDATCTAEGYTGDIFCTDCNTTISSGKALPAAEHDWHVTREEAATTTSEGKRFFTCSQCGATREEAIPKLPSEDHKHNYIAAVVKEATCTEAGEKKYTCACGDSYTESIPALGHNYTSRVTKKPTVYAEGVMTYTCSRCGDTYTKSIKKLASNPSTPDNRPGGGNPPIDDSNKDGWEIITDETDKAGNQSTVNVDKNGSAAVPPKSTGTNTGFRSPQTGQPWTLLQIMAISILVLSTGIGGFCVVRKKGKRGR